jgi:hypothetical protein
MRASGLLIPAVIAGKHWNAAERHWITLAGDMHSISPYTPLVAENEECGLYVAIVDCSHFCAFL